LIDLLFANGPQATIVEVVQAIATAVCVHSQRRFLYLL
jgi:hypothetical protein